MAKEIKEKGVLVGTSSDSAKPNGKETVAEHIEMVNLVKASDIVRDYFIKGNSPWIFLFQINSVEKNSVDNVYIVKCEFFPVQGGYEKNNYVVKVNTGTGELIEIKGFSHNIQTGVKKSLVEEPPK